MERVSHEYYVSPELAELLKEAGFDWRCVKNYIGKNHILWTATTPGNLNDNSEIHKGWKSAPTLDAAQRWLREVKNIDINILVESISSHKQYLVSIWFNISDKSAYDNAVLDNRYNTYEEAQEAGIKEALEIILEKGK